MLATLARRSLLNLALTPQLLTRSISAAPIVVEQPGGCIFDGASLHDKKGRAVSCDDKRLAGKSVALYFAGEWCPMCRAFTPSLREYYQKHKNDVQVVFVPSDETAEAAERHFEASQGSWLALRFGDPLVKRLKLQHGVWSGRERGEFGMAKRRAGVPSLVIVDRAGNELKFLPAESEGVSVLGDWDATARWDVKSEL